jgi:putative toxin-antitoxin system antitoxin component (TIGR02293 family)
MTSVVEEPEAVTGEMGGEQALGRQLHSDLDVQDAIREGFRPAVVAGVMHSADISLKQLAAALDLSERSLQRRKGEGRLSPAESDRIYRLARIVALAKQYLGEEALAHRWLKRPNRALGGKTPLEVLDTEPGARMVEGVLGRIAYGGVS